jgi:membrane peptidoglycan carboxypeptidase
VRPLPDVETTFEVGPANRDFTPLGDVSTHLVNSIMTTEDSRFFDHRGFIGREFRSALARDLRERRFALGASSITMQMVKNVMLTHEKTLARKLQELFLTWHVEQTLPKERILEIYLNVIELGPGIYGIGAAARHYFGKSPRDLTPREAAFFSSILPSPKRRYVHYCHGVPSPKWERYLDRILRRMHERGRLSQVDLETALASPLVFDRVEARPEVECLRFVKQIVEANQVPVLPDDEPLRENPGGVQNEPPGRGAPTSRPGGPP